MEITHPLVPSREGINPKSAIVRLSAHDEVQNLSSNQTCPRLREGIVEPKLEYCFQSSKLRPHQRLIIDPLLASTYLGGSGGDYISSIATDYEGNIFVSGMTYSSNFPMTSGSYDSTFSGYYDAFVSKMSGNLESLLASTYLGRTNYHDTGNYIALDSKGNVYVTGSTDYSNFPITQDVYDTTFNRYPVI